MDAAPDNRRQLGQLMVEEGLLSAEELEHALREQGETGKPLGETLVTLGYVSPGAVANALAEQHGGLLRTEFGVSTGLSSAAADAGPGLHAAPPVAPLTAASGEHDREHEHESSAPLGGGLRLARAPGAAPSEPPPVAPMPAPAAPAPVAVPETAAAPASAPMSSEEKAAELAKFASLHTDLDNARAELEQKTNRLSEMTSRLDDTVSQLRASQAARDAFAAKAAELEAQAQATAEPDPAQAARVQELEQSVADLQGKLAEAAEAAANPQPDPAAVARVGELEAQLQAAAADRETLAQNLAELQEKVTASEAPAEPDPALTALVQELQGQVVELKQAATAAEAVGQAESFRSQTLDAQLLTITAGRDALATQVAELQARLNETEIQPDPSQDTRIEQLEEQLQAVTAKKDALMRTVAELQEQAEAPAAPDPALTARVQELEAQLAARRDEPVVVQSDPTDTARIAALERTIAELQARLGETAQAREAEVARASAVAAARVTAVESQLQAAEAERNALAQNVEVLQQLFSGTTAAHEAAVAELETQLADREQRLAGHTDGTAAIEREYRAALEQVEQERDALAARFDELQTLMNETTAAHQATFARLEEQLVTVEPEESAHVLLVPAPSGYVLLERSGPAPEARTAVEIGPGAWGEGSFVVSRIGPSPLPGGPKHCAFLERV